VMLLFIRWQVLHWTEPFQIFFHLPKDPVHYRAPHHMPPHPQFLSPLIIIIESCPYASPSRAFISPKVNFATPRLFVYPYDVLPFYPLSLVLASVHLSSIHLHSEFLRTHLLKRLIPRLVILLLSVHPCCQKTLRRVCIMFIVTSRNESIVHATVRDLEKNIHIFKIIAN